VTVIIKEVDCTVKVNETCRSILEMNAATGKGSLVLTVNVFLLQKSCSRLELLYEKTCLQQFWL